MGQETGIEWTDHTFNPWRGCAKISEGCKHCYAEQLVVKRQGLPLWGEQAARKVAAESTWRNPVKWNAEAQRDGVRRRVFCASLADIFEEYAHPAHSAEVSAARVRLFRLIEQTPALDWLLLTKRTENVRRLVVEMGWLANDGAEWPRNLWIGCTVENQQRAEERLPHLLAIPAPVRFVSYEPALGPVDFASVGALGCTCDDHIRCHGACRFARLFKLSDRLRRVDWIIVGGESGPGARPFDLEWARATVAQCRDAGVPVFVKQMGSRPRGMCDWHQHGTFPPVWVDSDGVLPEVSGRPKADLCHAFDEAWWPCAPNLRDRKGGDMAEWPEDLRVRQVPRSPLSAPDRA